MNRKVSIITPVFNRLKELTRLYETLNNQTNDNFIWIIIDDGSEKPIDKVVNTWKKKSKFKSQKRKMKEEREREEVNYTPKICPCCGPAPDAVTLLGPCFLRMDFELL